MKKNKKRNDINYRNKNIWDKDRKKTGYIRNYHNKIKKVKLPNCVEQIEKVNP